MKYQKGRNISSQNLSFDYSAPKTLCLKLSGDWQISSGVPAPSVITDQLPSRPDVTQITFDIFGLTNWDSSLVSFLLALIKECQRKNIRVIQEGLPEGARKLLSLALEVEKKDLPRGTARESILEKIGARAIRIKDSTLSLLDFLGEIALALRRLVRGQSYFRRDDFMGIVQRCGAGALGLVSLISVLVGMILAFIGAIQLKIFGAQVFIADIVGIAMVRVMGAVMTGVIMSGRTGASFAAELGIMQTNEEIDALKTLGVAPVEFLVLPRLLAMMIMLPLLTLYADFMGILGGFMVSTGMLGINPVEYMNHTQTAVKLDYLWVGLVHSFVFGIIIAVAGCLRGMKCERSASGVGEATTSAVVTAITAIVIATAIITFVCQLLGV